MHVIISFMMTIKWNDVLMGYPHQQLYIVQNNAQEINLQGNRLREAYIAAAGRHLDTRHLVVGISVSATVTHRRTVCMHVPHSVTV